MEADKSRKLNCWEFMNCGREHGGLMVPLLGECPVSTTMRIDGVNDGRGAGRACWIASGGPGQCRQNRMTDASTCKDCRFYKRVLFEQEEHVVHPFAATTVIK